MLISKIKYMHIFTTLVVLIINYNVYSKNTYLKYSPSEDALPNAVNSVIMIGDKPSSIGLSIFYTMVNNKWTFEEKQYLIENYPEIDNDILSKKLNRGVESIKYMSKKLRIFKSKEYTSKQRSSYDTSNNFSSINKPLNDRFQSFTEKANKIYDSKYDYSKFKYVNSATKSTVICDIHGEFKVKPNSHIGSKRTECSHCKKQKNDDKSDRFNHFLQRANDLHNNKFDYSKFEYIDAKTYGIIICPTHGEFKQMPDKHIAENSKGCNKCWAETSRILLKERRPKMKSKDSLGKEDFINRCRLKFGDKFQYDLTNYDGYNKNKIKITCKIHGEFEQYPSYHVYNNTTGCYYCGKEKGRKSKTKNYDNFILQSLKIHGDKYIYPISNSSIYKNKKSIINIICKKHGEFKKKAQKHISGQGCYKCILEENIKNNILVGGYSEMLFDKKPILKDKKAYLYYLNINNGKHYKIGITTKSVKSRIQSIISKSKKQIKYVKILHTKEYSLYDAFKIEQEILNIHKEHRRITFWSTELFKKNISNEIIKYFT